MLEFIRFFFFTALLAAGLVCEGFAVFGVNRFGYSLNRLHPASIGDTLGMMFIVLSTAVYDGFTALSIKLLLVLAIMWLTCPLSGHLISLLVYRTDKDFETEVKTWRS